MNIACVQDLAKHLGEFFEQATPDITVERPPPQYTGDITINCFRLARALRNPPEKIAETAVAYLQNHSAVVNAEQVKAFVNVVLESGALFQDTVANADAIFDSCETPDDEKRRILVEFSAPNTNKPQHLGHVRNNSLGQSVVSILEKAGHTPIPVNLVNDRGIHICKSMIAYQRWGNNETPSSKGGKGDKFVGDFYVMFDKEVQRQAEELREQDESLKNSSDEELLSRTEIGAAAQEMLQAWENQDTDVCELWKKMNSWVLEGFEQTYERMGVRFDKTYLESETYEYGRELILDFLNKGFFYKRDDGAVAIDLSDEKLGEKILLRSDGTSVYVTQDIGTTIIKQNDFEPQQQVWIVGDEQIYHFKVLFAIFRKLGYPWADNLYHMPYGMVNLPEGKMKSREGTVVDADDLFDEMTSLAREATLQRYDTAPHDLDHRAGVIGMAALKFMLLKVSAKTEMTFDPNESLKFEGDTGPYVLYAHARIASMLRKAGEDLPGENDIAWDALGEVEEKELALQCAAYPDAVKTAAEKLDPSALADYVLELAKAFNQFYKACPVLPAEDPKVRNARLGLSMRTKDILKDGLNTLGLEVLESM